uniref:La-related protein 6 n=1 Tax=Hydra vulgaris TaxID=6087 RepID=T2M6G4_HYDVU
MANVNLKYENSSSDENKSDIDDEDRANSSKFLNEECISINELHKKIIAQAELYFSNENLLKDKFLLKHIKRNKEGYVNIKLIASFNRMRSLTKDFNIIVDALRTSSRLAVDENGLKLKRLEPLPKELLEQAHVQYLVLSDIPSENPSVDFIKNAFILMKNDILSVKIIKPCKSFPNDLQSHYSKHPELKEKLVALVEFKNTDSAKEASKTQFTEAYTGLKVSFLELGPKQLRNIASGETHSDADSDKSCGKKKKMKKKKNNVKHLSPREDSYSSCASSSDNEFCSFTNCSKRYSRSKKHPTDNISQHYKNERYNSSQNSSPLSSPSVSPVYHRKNKSGYQSPKEYKLSPLISNLSPLSSPDINRREIPKFQESYENLHSAWMLKRMELNKTNYVESGSTNVNSVCKQLEIIRQPKGPDGSNGFNSLPLIKYVLIHPI